MDLYAALGVDKAASAAQIKQAYRRKLLQEHPDKGGHKATFQRVKSAYEVLGDGQRRALYDKCGRLPEGADKENFGAYTPRGVPTYVTPSRRSRGLSVPGSASSASSSARRRQGGLGGGATPARQGRGRDARFPLRVTLEELYSGTGKKLRINRTVTCTHCRGCGAEEGRFASSASSRKKYADALCKVCSGSGVRCEKRATGCWCCACTKGGWACVCSWEQLRAGACTRVRLG
jgi:DnaJ-class molecular chaperone